MTALYKKKACPLEEKKITNKHANHAKRLETQNQIRRKALDSWQLDVNMLIHQLFVHDYKNIWTT